MCLTAREYKDLYHIEFERSENISNFVYKIYRTSVACISTIQVLYKNHLSKIQTFFIIHLHTLKERKAGVILSFLSLLCDGSIYVFITIVLSDRRLTTAGTTHHHCQGNGPPPLGKGGKASQHTKLAIAHNVRKRSFPNNFAFCILHFAFNFMEGSSYEKANFHRRRCCDCYTLYG